MTKSHADGTPCLEGTSRLPENFEPCCDVFDGHTSTCSYDLRYEYWDKPKKWVIAIAESAGGGGIEISYCPHCGTKLMTDDEVKYAYLLFNKPLQPTAFSGG